MRLYFDVDFFEKDDFKHLGGRWNPKLYKWYLDDVDIFNLDRLKEKFFDYILGKILILDRLYLIESEVICPICAKRNRVFRLGADSYVEYGISKIDDYEDLFENYHLHDDFGKYKFDREHIKTIGLEEDGNIPNFLWMLLHFRYNETMRYHIHTDKYSIYNHCKKCKEYYYNINDLKHFNEIIYQINLKDPLLFDLQYNYPEIEKKGKKHKILIKNQLSADIMYSDAKDSFSYLNW
ncbi:MAG: hypothetical protein Q4B52_05025 [Tissierellia bacterium]|nr:hypothetical protein [Tissierellia bacterium]